MLAVTGEVNRLGRTAGAMAGDDAELLARSGAGDASAYRVLVERHMPMVFATARRLLRDEAESEDVAQEAFLRLWHLATTLEIGASGIGPWVRRVAANLAIDRLRKGRRLDVTDDVPERESPPTQLDELARQDVMQRLDAALGDLPERQRIALTLFHYQGMSQREVADILDVSEDALESLLARARRRLRTLLKNEWRELLATVEMG